MKKPKRSQRMYKYWFTWTEGGIITPIYLTEHPHKLRDRLLTTNKIYTADHFGPVKLFKLKRNMLAHAVFFQNGDRIDAYNQFHTSWANSVEFKKFKCCGRS